MNKSIIIRCLIIALFAISLGGYAYADAKANWGKHCQRCHAADGSGNTKPGKKLKVEDYRTAEFQAKFTDEQMAKAIANGVKTKDGTERMEAYKKELSEQDIKDLVAYIRAMKK